MSDLTIREAHATDAESCSGILRASIRELCFADHGGDPPLIDLWLDNKTPETLRGWIEKSAMTIFVAETTEAIVAVGGIVDEAGEITLNYVHPDFRFRGVSKKLLGRLESELQSKGVAQAKLTSTETAHGFYKSVGWRDVADPERWLGMKGYPMRKAL